MTLGPLALDVQRRIEGLYGLDHGAAVTEFLVPPEAARSLSGNGSRTLVAQDGEEVSLGVVLDPALGRELHAEDPRRRLHAGNLGAYCALTEEVSHFLLLLFCARHERSVTELELELQGEVDKYLNAVMVLALQNEGSVSPHLRRLLFRDYRLADGVSEERSQRYRKASQLADRYCSYLETQFLRPARVTDLAREARRFYRMGRSQKLERISALG